MIVLVNGDIPKVLIVVVQEARVENLFRSPSNVSTTADTGSKELRGILDIRVVDVIVQEGPPVLIVFVRRVVCRSDAVLPIQVRFIAHLKTNEFVAQNRLANFGDKQPGILCVVERHACSPKLHYHTRTKI